MITKLNKTVGFLILSSLFLLSGCFFQATKGSGNIQREDRILPHFNSIEVSGAFDVFLKQGAAGIEIVADDNLIPLILTEVKGKTLDVYSNEHFKNTNKLQLYISYPELEKLDISGAVKVSSKGVIIANDFEIDASGATEIDLEVQVDELELDASGATQATISGTARKLDIEGSGATEIDAYELEAEYVKIELSGAGDAKVTARKKLEADVSGAGSIRYKGNPEEVNSHISGAGSIKPVNSN